MTANNDRDSRYDGNENKTNGPGEYGVITLGEDDDPVGLIIFDRANAKTAWMQTDTSWEVEP